MILGWTLHYRATWQCQVMYFTVPCTEWMPHGNTTVCRNYQTRGILQHSKFNPRWICRLLYKLNKISDRGGFLSRLELGLNKCVILCSMCENKRAEMWSDGILKENIKLGAAKTGRWNGFATLSMTALMFTIQSLITHRHTELILKQEGLRQAPWIIIKNWKGKKRQTGK